MLRRYDPFTLMAVLLYVGAALGPGLAGAADEPSAQPTKPETVQLLFVSRWARPIWWTWS